MRPTSGVQMSITRDANGESKPSFGERVVAAAQDGGGGAPADVPSELLADPPAADPVREPTGETEPAADPVIDPAVPDTVSDTEPEPQPISALVEKAQRFGFQNVRDEQDAQERILAHYEQVRSRLEEAEHYANLGREYARLQQDPNYLSYLQSRQQPQPVQQAEPTSPWDRFKLKYDPGVVAQWRERRVDPQTGEETVAWKPGTPADLREDAERYQAEMQQWQQGLLYRPHEVLPEFIGHEVSRRVDEILAQREAQQHSRALAQNIMSQNSHWLYVRDPVTQQPLRNPDGTYVFSEPGREVAEWAISLLNGPNEQDAWETAHLAAIGRRYLQSMQNPAPTQPAQTPAPVTTPDPRKKFLADTRRRPAKPPVQDRGQFPGPEDANTQNGNLTPGRRFLENFRQHNGGQVPV